jgi:hypothetical protein
MTEPRREDVVLIASTLYSIVAGLAITTAIAALLTRVGQTPGNVTIVLSPVDLVGSFERSLLVVSFFLFAIPFYHGATLVLATTMRSSSHEPVSGPMLDFFLLFLEAGILYAMALSVGLLNIFLSWIIALLVVDIVWASLARRRDSTSETLKRTLRWWIILDVPAAAFLLVLRLFQPLLALDEASRIEVLFVFTLVRTALDYGICRDFYFARSSVRRSPKARVVSGVSRN